MRGGRLYQAVSRVSVRGRLFRMKLIAVKNISARIPEGAIFEAIGSRAKMLIAVGLAKAAEEDRPVRRTYRRRDMQAEA
jgi:hypothetical protein